MKERNKYLESGGLFWESETHEWFNDGISTDYARKITSSANGKQFNDSLNIMCFVVRDKQTGEYDRVVLDKTTNHPIYATKSLEDLSAFIDRLKIEKRFKQ